MATAKKAAKAKKPKPLLQPLPESGSYEDGSSKFARALASNDYMTREKGLQALVRWMSRKSDVAMADMLKIWKSIFYCFWHSDKTPVQVELAKNLAGVLFQLSEEVTYTYFTAFVETMRREWFGIDRHRLDKYLMLVRTFYTHLFQLLSRHNWSLEVTQKYSAYLASHVLLPSDTYRALGFAYHTADVFVPELKKAAADAPPPSDVLQLLLEPFGQAMQKSKNIIAVKRYRESVFDEVKAELSSPSEGSPFRHLAAQQLADALFQLGAEEGVKVGCREELYDVSSALEKAASKRARKGDKGSGKGKGHRGSKGDEGEANEAMEVEMGAANGALANRGGPVTTPAGGVTPLSGKKKRKAGKDSPAPSPKPQDTPLDKPSPPSPSTSKPSPASTSKRKSSSTPSATPPQSAPESPVSSTPTNAPPSSAKGRRASRLSKVTFSTPDPTLAPPHTPAAPSPNGSAAGSGSDGSEAGTPGPAGHTPFSSGRRKGKGKEGKGAGGAQEEGAKEQAASVSSKGKGKRKLSVAFTSTPEAIPGGPGDGAGINTPSPSGTGPDIDQSTAGQTPFSASTGKRGKKRLSRGGAQEEVSTPEPSAEERTPLNPTSLNGTGGKKSQRKGLASGKSTGKHVGDGGKKSVVINLRKNLYFAPGSPAPQHTPPAAPKGILKKAMSTPNSAPAKSAAGRDGSKTNGPGPRRFLTPSARPRPKAASFF